MAHFFDAFNDRIEIRLDKDVKEKLEKIVRYKDEVENLSHACRIAVIQYLDREYPKIMFAKGRPKKYVNGRGAK